MGVGEIKGKINPEHFPQGKDVQNRPHDYKDADDGVNHKREEVADFGLDPREPHESVTKDHQDSETEDAPVEDLQFSAVEFRDWSVLLGFETEKDLVVGHEDQGVDEGRDSERKADDKEVFL